MTVKFEELQVGDLILHYEKNILKQDSNAIIYEIGLVIDKNENKNKIIIKSFSLNCSRGGSGHLVFSGARRLPGITEYVLFGNGFSNYKYLNYAYSSEIQKVKNNGFV